MKVELEVKEKKQTRWVTGLAMTDRCWKWGSTLCNVTKEFLWSWDCWKPGLPVSSRHKTWRSSNRIYIYVSHLYWTVNILVWWYFYDNNEIGRLRLHCLYYWKPRLNGKETNIVGGKQLTLIPPNPSPNPHTPTPTKKNKKGRKKTYPNAIHGNTAKYLGITKVNPKIGQTNIR